MKKDALSTTFAALADPTRRAILARLTEGEATVNELAAPHAMSLPSVSRHLKVLEHAGLVVKGRSATGARAASTPRRWRRPTRGWRRTAASSRSASPASKATRKRTERGGVMTGTALKHSFTLDWVLDAPPAEVFRAWTDPDHLGWFYNPATRCRASRSSSTFVSAGPGNSTWSSTGHGLPHGRRLPGDRAWREARVRLGGDRRLAPARPRAARRQPSGHVTLAEVGGSTEMSLLVELPASMKDDGLQDWWSMFQDGLRDTVDRLAAALSRTTTMA